MVSPSRRPPARRFELDWVVVSVSGARRWGLLLFFLLLVAAILGGVLYFLHEPIDRKAQRIIRRAAATQEEVKRAGVSDSLKGEFEEASRFLTEAEKDCERKDYPACLARGEDALRRLELLRGLVTRDFVGSGQIISLQGNVEIQRTNQTRWEKAREKQALYNGDFIKTGKEGAAEVIFSDGTVYRIGSDSLLEVHSEAKSGREIANSEVKVKVGQVHVYTATKPSSVLTDAARADIDHDSRVGVNVAEDTTATLSAYAGKATVTGKSGERVDLGTKQAISALPSGGLGQKRTVPDPPMLEQPAANSSINLDATSQLTLQWRAVAGATAYVLEVGRTQAFTQPLDLQPHTTNNRAVTLRLLRPGKYYWRVQTLGMDSTKSEWCSPRAFKVVTGPRMEVLSDTTPPKLEVAKPNQMGNFVIIQGTTEPGATVLINGEVVEVAGDGTFKKTVVLSREGANSIMVRATDPAGNPTERRISVFVEGD